MHAQHKYEWECVKFIQVSIPTEFFPLHDMMSDIIMHTIFKVSQLYQTKIAHMSSPVISLLPLTTMATTLTEVQML